MRSFIVRLLSGAKLCRKPRKHIRSHPFDVLSCTFIAFLGGGDKLFPYICRHVTS